MKTRDLICITCPRGCALRAYIADNGQVSSVTGNLCPRGKMYAEAEIVHPVRTLTTTVRTLDGRSVPVKTSSPIPKECLFSAMREIRALRISTPVKIGEVLITDLLSTGADLVVTADAE